MTQTTRDRAIALMSQADEIRRNASLRYRTGRMTAAEKASEFYRASLKDAIAMDIMKSLHPGGTEWAEKELAK